MQDAANLVCYGRFSQIEATDFPISGTTHSGRDFLHREISFARLRKELNSLPRNDVPDALITLSYDILLHNNSDPVLKLDISGVKMSRKLDKYTLHHKQYKNVSPTVFCLVREISFCFPITFLLQCEPLC